MLKILHLSPPGLKVVLFLSCLCHVSVCVLCVTVPAPLGMWSYWAGRCMMQDDLSEACAIISLIGGDHAPFLPSTVGLLWKGRCGVLFFLFQQRGTLPLAWHRCTLMDTKCEMTFPISLMSRSHFYLWVLRGSVFLMQVYHLQSVNVSVFYQMKLMESDASGGTSGGNFWDVCPDCWLVLRLH